MSSALHNTIRELRATRSMTQQELADLILVTRQTVIAIEGDKYSPSASRTSSESRSNRSSSMIPHAAANPDTGKAATAHAQNLSSPSSVDNSTNNTNQRPNPTKIVGRSLPPDSLQLNQPQKKTWHNRGGETW